MSQPLPLLSNYDSTRMSLKGDLQLSYFDKLATLTELYLELGLRWHEALRAAEADV
jgi:hypothetical protein